MNSGQLHLLWLMLITSNDLAFFVVTTAENPDTDRGFFIGLIDTDPVASEPTREVERFTWTDGAAFVFGNESGTFPWRQDQPNNLGAVVENCVEVMKETSFWNDVACSFEAKMICRSPCQEVATGAQGAMLVTGLGFFGSVLIMIFLIFHIRRHRTYDHTLDNAGIQILMPEDAVPERRRALSGLPMIDKNNRTKGLHFFSGVSSGTFSRSSITTRSSVRSNGTDVTKISVPLSSVPKVRSRLRPKLVPPEPVQSRQALYKQNVRKNSLDVSL